jgi:NYN domain/OST-HTH/LOTUS domain
MAELTSEVGNRRIAMLIDGDNAQPSLAEKMLAETGKYGVVAIRRAYGDWTTPNMGGWKETLQAYAIQPIQQFRYTIGKNATDSALIIDAMDILYDGAVHGFCLVSSDSDYTRLATRVQEKGFFVMGIGKKTTPKAFVNACNVFVFVENLTTDLAMATDTVGKPQKKSKAAEPAATDPVPLLVSAFEMAQQDDGQAHLAMVGQHLRQLDPSFDARTYGYKQLSLLIRAYPKVFSVKGDSISLVKRKEK